MSGSLIKAEAAALIDPAVGSRARSETESFVQDRFASPIRITVLGATGSIGDSTLDLIAREPKRYAVEALTANGNAEKLAALARTHRARIAVVADPAGYAKLKACLEGTGIEAAAGDEAVVEAAKRPVDFTMAAITGAAGLRPTFAALANSKRLGLANKECLVCAGALLLAQAQRLGCEVLPVDSEHSGVFQALAGEPLSSIERIVITASGGPFRSLTTSELERVTPEAALKHPNWSMGRKITVDSATLMNKGLELIEAYHLFPVGLDRLDAIIHPQSVVHALVHFTDGSVLAQLALPDMRLPIAISLAWPERRSTPTPRLDLAKIQALTFEPIDEKRFPAIRLAKDALTAGGGAPVILNAANEIAVEAFLAGRIRFSAIAETVARSLEAAGGRGLFAPPGGLDHVLALDAEGRKLAVASMAGLA